MLVLSAAHGGFTVKDLAAKVHVMTGQPGYTIRQSRLQPHWTAIDRDYETLRIDM